VCEWGRIELQSAGREQRGDVDGREELAGGGKCASEVEEERRRFKETKGKRSSFGKN